MLNLNEDRPLWFNPVIESGLIYSRVLLEFLGIKRDKKRDLIEMTSKMKEDDISITDFGLQMLTVREAISGFSYASPEDVCNAFSHVIEVAHKGVAHLTVGPTLPGTFPSLRLACRVVIDLVWRHLYVPLKGHPLMQDAFLECPIDFRIDEEE